MENEFDERPCANAMSDDEEQLLEELGLYGESRRRFLGQVGTAGFSLLALQILAEQEALAATGRMAETAESKIALENAVKVALKVNGEKQALEVDSRMTLLDTLRERLALTGSKKGCDRGQCGACTVIIDGERVLSCLLLTATCEGKEVTTIEGIAEGESLHPIQAAFIEHDGFQCGYCTPGQICSSVALLDEAKNGELSYLSADPSVKAKSLQLSDDEIRERMAGNLCRCGAYPNIIKAIQEVHSGREVAQTWSFYNSEKEGRDETV
ncbi:MAG: 2Fe-2S iron-sulfur cluster-binding protein [Acidobacteriota bacterium]|nr:2Fe-2S iron-sulfur cluster-binding protein [Acidobacteriota bacterium]MDH3530484.1 2Fe-2S iron-sulfur cluster-binding protein [Acidobacteriota bacterium]